MGPILHAISQLSSIAAVPVGAVSVLPPQLSSVTIRHPTPYAFWLVDVLPFLVTAACAFLIWKIFRWWRAWFRGVIFEAVGQAFTEARGEGSQTGAAGGPGNRRGETGEHGGDENAVPP